MSARAQKKTSRSSRTNGKMKRGKAVENSSNAPLSGIFDAFVGNVAPSSQPWELSESTSFNFISLQRVLLSYAYTIHGPIRTLVDQPVLDAFRGGIKIKSDEVSPDEIEEMHRFMKRIKFNRTMVNALRWDRLFGGSGVIINVNEDFSRPLKVESITDKNKIGLIAADRWELVWSGTPNDPRSAFNYYGKTVHQSRVAKIVGEEAPSMVSQRLQGWGMSAIECVIRELNSYLKENNVIFELLDEAKVDVWKIRGFNSQVLAPLVKSRTSKRIEIANTLKNFLNSVVLDAEDDYQQKQLTFSGLADILEQIRIGMAAAIRMPMAKIFGLAAKGFASGEDDLENYNSIVEGQRARAEEVFDVVMPILCMNQWGFVPDDLEYEWRPLRVLTAEQEEIVKTAQFERHRAMYQDGIYNPQEYCEALKKANILTIETEVSKGADPEPPMNSFGLSEDDFGGSGAETSKPSQGKKPTKAKE